jgi:hypothetical protein
VRETTSGKITATRKSPVGTNLAQAHASGATSLVVVDPFPFDEDGGTLDVNGVTYTYTGWDDDTDTITLTTGLTAAAEVGDPVLLLPLETEMVAIVVEDESGEQIESDVRHADASSLPEGPVTAEVTASLVLDGDRWLIDDIIGRTPTPDAGMLTGTVPNAVLDDTDFAQDLAQALADIAQQSLDIATAASTASSALGAATTAQTTANGKNTVTYSTSAPAGTTNGNGTAAVAGDLWFRRTGAIIIGQWEYVPGTGWVARTLDNAVIANLDAAKITSGFLDVANRVKAGSITTPLLAVTGANVFPDPEFQNTDWLTNAAPNGRYGNGTGWDYYTAGNGARAVRYTVPAGAADGYFNVFPTLSGASQAKDGWLSVEEGSSYLLRFAHFKTATRHKVYANWVKADGTTGGTDFLDRETNTAWVTAGGSSTSFRSYILAVPAGVTRIAVRVQIQGTAGQTWAMYGQGITLSRMGDGELIVDGAITATKIAAGAMSAKIIDGDVIRTSAGNQRVQISTAGIVTYNSSNAVTSTLSAASGGMDLTGRLYVKDEIQVADFVSGNIVMALRQGELTFTTAGGAPNAAYTRFYDDGAVGGPFTIYADHQIQVRATSDVQLFTVGGYVNGKLQTNQVYAFQAAITNSRAVYVNATTGNLHTASSSERFKDEVETMHLDLDHFLSGRSVYYVDREQKRAHLAGETVYDTDGNEIPIPAPTREAGRIAEEVHALGYTELVSYDDDQPADLHYLREVAFHYEALRQLHARVTALEGASA